ncbi:hypothetical protein B6U81_06500 [Thermoplasmatales archaeon ex4484_30]|nr:MAG: hypothetical protein B6U81_06500 [Thermoplasmatales archaeon ex4484_30]
MKILMVVAYFVPEIGSAAHVYFDLAKAFVNRGHNVDVITSYPRKFNLNKSDREKNFPMDENIDGINVHRCKHSAVRDTLFLRGLEHFTLPRIYFKRYKKLNKKFDVGLIYIPPLPLYYFARMIKRYDGTPFVLNFQDFHPQELIDVGIMKNKAMIKLMEYIERKAYKNADFITVLSNGGIKYVTNRGGDPAKIRHIYNGVILSEIDKYLVKRDFKGREGIDDKFLITYAGILSPFQGVENILEVAKILKKEENIIFYIVGDGMIRKKLEERIEKENITNVKLLPFQPREEYFNIINSSDISIVSLDIRMKAPCLPGKLVNLMAAKQPIIALVPEDSETAYVINKANCGIVVSPSNINKFADTIMKLKTNEKLRKELGGNGRKFLQENMNLEKNAIAYEKIFEKLIEKRT